MPISQRRHPPLRKQKYMYPPVLPRFSIPGSGNTSLLCNSTCAMAATLSRSPELLPDNIDPELVCFRRNHSQTRKLALSSGCGL